GKRFALSTPGLRPLPFIGGTPSGDDCMDAGGRVTQDAQTEGWGEGGSGDSELPDSPSPPFCAPTLRRAQGASAGEAVLRLSACAPQARGGRQARSPDAIRG